MKECKSIEVTHSPEIQIRQLSKPCQPGSNVNCESAVQRMKQDWEIVSSDEGMQID
jgi:hypothetical protein